MFTMLTDSVEKYQNKEITQKFLFLRMPQKVKESEQKFKKSHVFEKRDYDQCSRNPNPEIRID